MKRNIVKLTMVMALFTGFAMAQTYGSQRQPGQSQQTPQTQQQPMPETQQMPQSQSQSQTQSQTQTGTGSQNVQSQIQQQPELSSVTVNESSDKIELSGTVASKADKEKAKSIAESSSGGRKVVNKIKVNSSNPSTPSPMPPRY